MDAWNATYGATLSSSLFAGTGTLSNPGSFTTSFDGLVDSNAVQTAGFGAGQLNTHFVNGLSDAAVYSAVIYFTITGFDNSQQYIVDIVANDCCYVSGGGGTSFGGQLQFDITQTVPEPATLSIMLLGIIALFRHRFSKK